MCPLCKISIIKIIIITITYDIHKIWITFSCHNTVVAFFILNIVALCLSTEQSVNLVSWKRGDASQALLYNLSRYVTSSHAAITHHEEKVKVRNQIVPVSTSSSYPRGVSGQTGRSAPPGASIVSGGEGARLSDRPDSSSERSPFDLPSSWFLNTNWWGGTKHPDAQPARPPGPRQSYVLSCRADSTTHTEWGGVGGLKPETQNNIVPLFSFLLWFLFSLSIFSTFTATSQPLSVMSEPAEFPQSLNWSRFSSLIGVIPSLRDLRIRTTVKMGRDVNALAGRSVWTVVQFVSKKWFKNKSWLDATHLSINPSEHHQTRLLATLVNSCKQKNYKTGRQIRIPHKHELTGSVRLL